MFSQIVSHDSSLRFFRFDCQTANAPPPGWQGAGAPCPFSAPRKNEGSRAPTGAGAEAPHPVARLAAGRSPDRRRSPANDAGRRAFRRSAAAFSLRRRAALSPMAQACPPIVSQLLAGDHSVPGRSPDAARVRGCEPRPRAPPQSEARNCRAPAAGFEDLFSGPASGLLRHQDASRWRPSASRVHASIRVVWECVRNFSRGM